ncbi:hypothetical protein [Desulfitobacterium metallireducens]|uniref:Uncharacterized protein n=1 Tax=Desulfitobacterium metallireducens DSM 15288 TaxID=871968 RepID=W0EGI2_9FIRM|nr:hypothetical protein [Desulfitobacterium metallireducens]AHF08628.1 hypothetical protein DESME_10515 [Desulfitobacterium metallireducens DSM 15288]
MLGIEYHRLKYLVIVGGALFLMGLIYYPIHDKNQELNVERKYWQAQVELQRPEIQQVMFPTLMDLPTTIEECQRFFKEENVQVLSVNLDRIENESKDSISSDQPRRLSYALFHFKLAGSWSGIETAFQHLENNSDQAIQIQEVRLNPEGGESVLKVYFYEPDKPDSP